MHSPHSSKPKRDVLREIMPPENKFRVLASTQIFSSSENSNQSFGKKVLLKSFYNKSIAHYHTCDALKPFKTTSKRSSLRNKKTFTAILIFKGHKTSSSKKSMPVNSLRKASTTDTSSIRPFSPCGLFKNSDIRVK